MDIEVGGEDGAVGPLTFPSKESASTDEHDFNAEEDVICILCSSKFVLPNQKILFINHLLTCHQFIISDMRLIASVKMYCEYWRTKFASVPPKEICLQKMSTAKLNGSKVSCLVLGDFIPEDKELRHKLQTKRAIWAYAQHAKESEDKNFTRGCLFCQLQFHGLRADYLNHLSLLHNLQFRKPADIVFVDDLLNAIERKLENLRCLLCSKIFKDRTVLEEHMRKKQHKKIYPSHVEFYKYYVMNYLEMGKVWQEEQNEPDDERSTVDEMKNENNSDGYLSDLAEDLEPVESPVVCLFCEASSTFENTLKHLKDFHNFDFITVCNEAGLDFLNQAILVNYIRHKIRNLLCPYCNECCPSEPVLLGHMDNYSHFALPAEELWSRRKYLFVNIAKDSFLCRLYEHQENMNETQLSHEMMENSNVGQS